MRDGLTSVARLRHNVRTMPALRAFRQPKADRNWFEMPLAQRVLRFEHAETAALLAAQSGVRGVFLRPAGSSPMSSGRGSLRAMIHLHRTDAGFGGDLSAACDALPFQSQSVCVIHAFHVLESLSNPGCFLAECARVLRPGGTLLVVVLQPFSPWRFHWACAMPGAISAQRVQSMIEATGLSIEQEMAVGPVWLSRGEFVRRQRAPDSLRVSRLMLVRRREAGVTPLPQRARRMLPGVSVNVR